MATDHSNPGDFISLSSSEDERPLPKKRRSPEDDSASTGGRDASAERSKRARVSSASADSITGAKVSEEGEIDDDGDSEGEIHSPDTGGEGGKSGDVALGSVFVPKDAPVYSADSISLQLPVFSQQREGSWHARFKEWVQLLCTANSAHATQLTPAVIRAAYKQYIDIHSRLKPNKKRSARQAAERFEDATLAHLLKTLQPEQPAEASARPESQMGASDQLPAPDGKNDETTTNGQPEILTADLGSVYVFDVKPQDPQTLNTRKMQPAFQFSANTPAKRREGVPSGAEALEQQRRYFPSASDPSNMCLLCGREGHIADHCTYCSCKFCGQDDHWDYACSSIKIRCRKCNQLGHIAAACVEKLALTKDEGLACSYCSSPDHLETECTQIWRSFHPETGTIKTVTALPVSCSACGSGQHYSGDCPQRQSYAPNPTWSLANKSQYLDPTCNSSAIEGASTESAPERQSELRIRGHAARTNNVHYSEGEDSDDVEFLGHRAVPKPVRTGHIRVSANLQAPNGGPPLPPGPPPPWPAQPSGRRPPTGPSSLPARPPPSRDYSSVPPPPTQPAADARQQSGRGGRGGGRGGRGGSRGYRGGKPRGGKFR